ncbi:Response regulator receiver domain protein (CheY-like) [gamma proteobacterium HdN1]|nr:Response regulator receiver domain protein (CheY-like) [gamma proteobacterium HdN1]
MAQILVVDDSAAIRNEVSTFLKSKNFAVETAVDGKDGLTKIKADKELKLIISDVNMPNMDGLTMAEKVRSELGNQSVNIIMLTTENDPNMKNRGKAAGVKGWIVKPFNGTAALGAIQKLVSG